MRTNRDPERIAFMLEHTPPGCRPNFRLLAAHLHGARRGVSLMELTLKLAWFRWRKRLRVARADASSHATNV